MNRRLGVSTWIMAGAIGLIFLSPMAGAQADTRMLIRFGVVPQQSATTLATLWLPIMERLSNDTGYQVVFETQKDITTFAAGCAAGEYDLVYLNPFHYTVYAVNPGYRAIAKERDVKIHGIVVTRKDAPYQTMGDLSKMTLAFPSPTAFAATILTQDALRKKGISFTPHYVLSHDSVYLAVEKGLFPAGGGVVRTFENMRPEIRHNLRILYTTPGYTPHAFAASPRLESKVVQRLTNALVGLQDDEQGQALLQRVHFLNGLEPATDSDWDDIRTLDINPGDIANGGDGQRDN
jgi:phosphonate transport system substrate-binding protein